VVALGSTALTALRLTGPLCVVVTITVGLSIVLIAGRKRVVEDVFRTATTRVVPAILGWAMVIVALDAGAGNLWQRLLDDQQPMISADTLADVELPPATDPRAGATAYGGADWVDRYFAEFEALGYGYVPFIGPRVEPVAGRYINSADGVRRSYQPAGTNAVEVWFFGGSTMWGEGQRDEYTIPSFVSRLAEAEGVPLRVVNYGERGYTAYQEWLLFEQELSAHGAPDLVLFYDGINEIGTQMEAPQGPSGQPTVYQLDAALGALESAPALPGGGAFDQAGLWARYRETSGLHKLLRRLGIDPAGAEEASGDLADAVENAADIYHRSVELQRDVARRFGVPIINYWQPGPVYPAYLDLTERLPRGVVDLSETFSEADAEDRVFIDGGHTNELGARLVAEAMWDDLRVRIAELGAL